MAVACGEGFTALVAERGDLWAFGKTDCGQLGLGTDAYQLQPVFVGGADKVFDGEAVVMVSAGTKHTACVTAKGTLWSWGNGQFGKLGHGDGESTQSQVRHPVRLGRERFGGWPAVMVACGDAHTLVLTAASSVWSCGWGHYGQLGHSDTVDQLVLTLVEDQGFRGAHIVMVSAGLYHSVALGADGRVWTFGWGHHGQLGHNDEENRLVPTLLAREALGGAAAVLVAAGGGHTVAVTREGALWVWGYGNSGQLGLGDDANRLLPTCVGAEAVFGGSQVLTADCSYVHTLIVTKAGTLWAFGFGGYGALGHNDYNNWLVPTRIEAQHFGNAKIVSAAAGQVHSAAVTEEGALYTWGTAPGLGHADEQAKLVPTLVAPHLLQGTRVGRCHRLPPLHALAFAMGTHARLGSTDETVLAADATGCAYLTIPGELVLKLVEACVSWPEGRAGELEGVVRILGGGGVRDEM